MEVVRFSEVLVNFYQVTQRYIPGGRHNQLRENLKSHKDKYSFVLQPNSQLYVLKVKPKEINRLYFTTQQILETNHLNISIKMILQCH
jgi:hypothetical protein